MEHLSGAASLWKSLEAMGVEIVFGLPGGAILPVYDPLLQSSIRHVLVRHEQAAGHAAEGYAWVSARPGVAIATSGPGATNLVTPLANAMMDSTPLVCVTGQVPSAGIGTDAFQECDITGITMGITKHNWLVTDPATLPDVVASAFHVATTGRPGPVLIDLPKDVATSTTTFHEPRAVDLPGYRLPGPPDRAAVAAAVALLETAERPVLYVGGGVVKADATKELAALVELTDAPVVTTLMARGAFPDRHPRCLGMPGMHGTYAAVTALQRADLILALGSRFDDRVTGDPQHFAPGARVVHVDIDRAEINKVRRPDVAIVADCRAAIRAIVELLASNDRPSGAAIAPWLDEVRSLEERFPLVYDREPGDAPHCKPQRFIEQLSEMADPETIVVAGVGQHQMWASQFFQFRSPRTWVNSGGLGTMGFAVPAAIGAKAARPEAPVWAIDGDGCFQMTGQELVTAASARLPIKVALLNNSALGMVRQWQELFYNERYSAVHYPKDLPDYVGWAEAMGAVGLRVRHPEEIAPAIEKANAITDRTVLLDVRIDPSESVYPMVPAGASNDEIVLHPMQTALMQTALMQGAPRC